MALCFGRGPFPVNEHMTNRRATDSADQVAQLGVMNTRRLTPIMLRAEPSRNPRTPFERISPPVRQPSLAVPSPTSARAVKRVLRRP